MNKQYSQPVRRSFRPKVSNWVGVAVLFALIVVSLLYAASF